MKHELTQEIRHMLAQQYDARCLDDEEDFKVVMEAIEGVIERWVDNRCPGCR